MENDGAQETWLSFSMSPNCPVTQTVSSPLHVSQNQTKTTIQYKFLRIRSVRAFSHQMAPKANTDRTGRKNTLDVFVIWTGTAGNSKIFRSNQILYCKIKVGSSQWKGWWRINSHKNPYLTNLYSVFQLSDDIAHVHFQSGKLGVVNPEALKGQSLKPLCLLTHLILHVVTQPTPVSLFLSRSSAGVCQVAFLLPLLYIRLITVFCISLYLVWKVSICP